jgi:hypothetical protein
MTGLYVASQAVFLARQDVGYHEGRNNRNKFSAWQYGAWDEPWCDSAVSYWSYGAGFRFPGDCRFGEKGSSWVTETRQVAQRHGLWRDRNAVARPGWLVIFSFTEPDQHIEMVVADTGAYAFSTIGGNTSDMVAYRTRYRSNVVGFVAMDEAGQNSPGAVQLGPREIKQMGMTAAAAIPGAHAQAKAPWKGRKPFVGAVIGADGSTDMVGFNGANLVGGHDGLGESHVKIGRLNQPIMQISPDVDAHGNFTGSMTGLAGDGGTFNVKVTVRYL